MKTMYWRPQRVSSKALFIIAAFSAVGLFAVENFKVQEKQSNYSLKIKAGNIALTAFDAVKSERIKRGIAIDSETDPAQSGLIGELLTPVTTNPGHLPAKQTSANPNFAAVILHMLKRAGVEKGDKVAVGMSGSFPALNICTLAAIKVIGAEPVIITSVGSSQWGANVPQFMWPDMEKILADRNLLPYRTIAMTRGGIEDRALGLTKAARDLLDEAAKRNGGKMYTVRDYQDSVEVRSTLYKEHSDDKEYTAYINVGGGTSSVGTKVGKHLFEPGLNMDMPKGIFTIDSVMMRFISEGTPVIHLSQIDEIAKRYGLPLQPTVTPKIGEGKIFYKEVYSKPLIVAILVAIVLLLVFFVRMDWGYRIMVQGKKPGPNRPERMV